MPELNSEQTKAVEHGEGALLVVAGPGTGKTRVITERIIWLLANGQTGQGSLPLKPENVLALTFTEKAAGEMKSRLTAALPQLETHPTISTFHAFCYQTLRRRHADRRLLDKIDVWIFLRRRMAELGLQFYQKLAEPGAFLHDLNDFFARCQDELIEPDDFDLYVHRCEGEIMARHARIAAIVDGISQKPEVATARLVCPGFLPGSRNLPPAEVLAFEGLLKKRELAHVFRSSRRMIEASGSSSLGSLVSETVALWRRDPAALAEARAQFRAVLVDELQDTNYAQMELLKLLVPRPYAITAVGDDDQAIYRFRGASHGAFEMFSRAFPGHQVVYLTRNYRSTERILRAAGAVIAHNDRYEQKPRLSSRASEGRPVYLVKAADPASEAAWIAQEIERLARQGLRWRDIAVLYRAHSYRDLLAAELRRKNVPLAIRGLSVLSTPILRDLIAYLRVIHSPRENVSLTRLLAAPRWSVPETLAQTIREQAGARRSSLYDAIKTCSDPQELERTGWSGLENLLATFRRLARPLPLTAVIDRLIERLGWRFVPEDPNQRYLEAFRKFVESWGDKSETQRLDEFIEYFDYFLEAGGKLEAPEALGDAVQMMTVHAAKGLEFTVVFVLGVSPRRFPATERRPVIEFPLALRKGPVPPKDIHVQEERRLFFVALTRARERLYVSGVSKSERLQSTFIRDLMSDPALRARDLEVIEVPEAPLAVPAAERKPRGQESQPQELLLSEKALTARERQGSLFDAGTAVQPEFRLAIAEWANRAPAEPGKDLCLSATSAEDYLACPLKYKFQHVLKIPTGPQAALTFGNLMHQCVRHYFDLRRERQSENGSFRQPMPSFEEMEQFYLGRWRSAGFDDSYHEETYRKAGLDQLRDFVAKHNAMTFDAQRIQMEQSFRLVLDGTALEGRIDQMNFLDPMAAQEVELVDYKTGRARTEKDAEKSLQLSVYALAAKNALGLKAARLTFYNLSTNDAVSTARTAADLGAAAEKISEVAGEIRAGRFEATPGFACRWCDYIPICPAHEDV